ncbi:hypothetical protein [Mycobacteroides chelonae]|nr:hypothetical protein [Mycobacteroides chelonae]MBF9328236.1 hypothetical protein [Mycobacteroides chelonae]MBF9422414.1 hypothetical protein [Mycobacteroides chelonae]MBF9435427.1 hypothetical protein [Mycobacteroides chelonae]MEC4837039.1 hypothetical protein [Mycobacteroides chelonae]MEC4858863.1 hypothetical protein [Mycobacteroides chelonae]
MEPEESADLAGGSETVAGAAGGGVSVMSAEIEVYLLGWDAASFNGGAKTAFARVYMAVHSLWSAQRSAQMCSEREAALVAEGTPRLDPGHRADAINAVVSAAMFIEGFVNELFSDAADKPHGTPRTRGLSDTAREQMRELWKGGAVPSDRISVIHKYQLALLCAGKRTFDPGCAPLQDVTTLIQLRNYLIHYNSESPNTVDLQKVFIGVMQRAGENRQPVGPPLFPNKVLGAGCANWACDTAARFVIEWQERLGLEHDYRSELESYPVEFRFNV